MKMNDIKNEVINLYVKRLNFQPGSRKRQFLDDFSVKRGGLKVLYLQYYDIYEKLKGKRKSETKRKQNQLVQEKNKKKSTPSPDRGLEPLTLRLKVWCSTDWANRAPVVEHGIFYIIISMILYRTILVLILCRMETTCDGLLIRKFIVKKSVEISHLSSPLEPTL